MKSRMYLTLYVFAFGVYVMFCLNCRTHFFIKKVCPKSYGQVFLQTNTSSVTACSEKCASNYTCRSFIYDPATTSCTLNSLPKYKKGGQPGFTDYNCTSLVYYGKPTKHTCLDKWLLDPCDTDADCSPTHSACIAAKPYLPSQCLCKSGFPYNFRNNSCLSRCDEYGNWVGPDIYFIDYTFETRKVQDHYECSALCYDTYASRCRQFLYIWMNPNINCYLSSETALTKPDDKILITSNPFAWTWIRGCA